MSLPDDLWPMVVTGSRDWEEAHADQVLAKIDRVRVKTEALKKTLFLGFGDAEGVDEIVWNYAKVTPGVEFSRFEANWDLYGRSAGPKRNRYMLDTMRPHRVLAFLIPTLECRGTWDCIEAAQARGIPVDPFRLRA